MFDVGAGQLISCLQCRQDHGGNVEAIELDPGEVTHVSVDPCSSRPSLGICWMISMIWYLPMPNI